MTVTDTSRIWAAPVVRNITHNWNKYLPYTHACLFTNNEYRKVKTPKTLFYNCCRAVLQWLLMPKLNYINMAGKRVKWFLYLSEMWLSVGHTYIHKTLLKWCQCCEKIGVLYQRYWLYSNSFHSFKMSIWVELRYMGRPN